MMGFNSLYQEIEQPAYLDPFLAQAMAEERIEGTLYQVGSSRPAHVAQAGRSSPGRRLSMALVLSVLLGLIGRGEGACR